MPEAITYTARELLRDGSQIDIRALRREDEADMLAAIGKTSAQSLQRRFFVMKRHFSDKERAFFMDIDFKNHVAIVAVAEEAGRKVIVGGGRYIVFEPGRAYGLYCRRGRIGRHRGRPALWRRGDLL